MVKHVNQYCCDLCRKKVNEEDIKDLTKWTLGTEVGDLCPSCSTAWANFKQSFIEKTRMENGEKIL